MQNTITYQTPSINIIIAEHITLILIILFLIVIANKNLYDKQQNFPINTYI